MALSSKESTCQRGKVLGRPVLTPFRVNSRIIIEVGITINVISIQFITVYVIKINIATIRVNDIMEVGVVIIAGLA